ncbi:hypothetical protein KGF56_001999 [Candida oxycetoniae]|uniref:Uncharacterized protein n=1 Tax=Candida oxycetoniae TaxID=497107 RepID=A0AAI9SY14_9ASCO|nr:uncharacterized protein KGF56_001999 [Candida oxycetoniae]KAI3405192.2 hypothetical protein KGF56_001999 [Candida oxycetoniae]
MLSARVLKPASIAFRSYSTGASVTGKPRKISGFRGGVIGLLLGITLTGGASYYYLLDQYNFANEVVQSDVVALQTSIAKLEEHISKLERD